MNASLPQQTRDNGSLYAHVFIHPAGVSPFNSPYTSHAVAALTVYSLPQDESINLLSSGEKPTEVSQTVWFQKKIYTFTHPICKFQFSSIVFQ